MQIPTAIGPITVSPFRPNPARPGRTCAVSSHRTGRAGAAVAAVAVRHERARCPRGPWYAEARGSAEQRVVDHRRRDRFSRCGRRFRCRGVPPFLGRSEEDGTTSASCSLGSERTPKDRALDASIVQRGPSLAERTCLKLGSARSAESIRAFTCPPATNLTSGDSSSGSGRSSARACPRVRRRSRIRRGGSPPCGTLASTIPLGSWRPRPRSEGLLWDRRFAEHSLCGSSLVSPGRPCCRW